MSPEKKTNQNLSTTRPQNSSITKKKYSIEKLKKKIIIKKGRKKEVGLICETAAVARPVSIIYTMFIVYQLIHAPPAARDS
jgi:hypothetical protein